MPRIVKRRRVRKKTSEETNAAPAATKEVRQRRKTTTTTTTTTTKLEDVDTDLKMKALEVWRRERENALLRTSTKIDLVFYLVVIVGAYICMRVFYNIDLIDVVCELLEITQH